MGKVQIKIYQSKYVLKFFFEEHKILLSLTKFLVEIADQAQEPMFQRGSWSSAH